MKRFIAVAAVGAGLLIPASSAIAEPPGTQGYCGSETSGNGCTAAFEAGAQCGTGGGSGAFGAFGTYGYRHDYRGGANGGNDAPGDTGYNNSHVCGEPQN